MLKSGKKPENVPGKLSDEILEKLMGSCPHLYAPYSTQVNLIDFFLIDWLDRRRIDLIWN